MPYDITLISGDGIGPEVAEGARRVLDASGVQIRWEVVEAGANALKKYGTVLPDVVLDSIVKHRVALKGPITTPVGTGFRSVNVALRQALNLYACVRPCKTYHGVHSRYDRVDLVVVRENTEDLYAGIEFERGKLETADLMEFLAQKGGQRLASDSAISIKAISETASRRIVTFAFEYARASGRRKVTAVHKANIMKFSDGLFLATAREVAKQYPDIQFEDVIVDAMCTHLVQRPEAYDVLVMPNLYGDILSDLCAGLVGGLGVAPGANIGDRYAVFEATHGSAPSFAGLNKLNPMGLILSGVLMLRHLGEREAADRVERALVQVVAEGRSVTCDLKPTWDDPTAVGTSQMADAIIEAMSLD